MTDTDRVLERMVLGDLLEDAILSARPGDKPFPLRVMFGQLGHSLDGDTAFAFAAGLNFYFRSAMEEEDKARLGVEVSRHYYRFAAEGAIEAPLVKEVSPLLAALMSSELRRLRLESVDHASVFDSQVHERDEGADKQSPRITRPATFLLRIASNGMVKTKARVVT